MLNFKKFVMIFSRTYVVYFEGLCKAIDGMITPPAVDIDKICRRVSQRKKEVTSFPAWVYEKLNIKHKTISLRLKKASNKVNK